MTPEPLAVEVVTWDDVRALAYVDDVRVRIRRRAESVRWSCDRCGWRREPFCEHTQALAEHPAEPDKRRTPRGPADEREPMTHPTWRERAAHAAEMADAIEAELAAKDARRAEKRAYDDYQLGVHLTRTATNKENQK